MKITAHTTSARITKAAYRDYLRIGYGKRLSRKLIKLIIEDARAGKYPLRAY